MIKKNREKKGRGYGWIVKIELKSQLPTYAVPIETLSLSLRINSSFLTDLFIAGC